MTGQEIILRIRLRDESVLPVIARGLDGRGVVRGAEHLGVGKTTLYRLSRGWHLLARVLSAGKMSRAEVGRLGGEASIAKMARKKTERKT